ncbi:MAG: hypothetical protein WB630_19205 [Candidatus Acidiferrales bacterium]
MSELGQKDLPRAIPAERLQAMLGANPAFCSWDAEFRGTKVNGRSLAVFIVSVYGYQPKKIRTLDEQELSDPRLRQP